MTSPAYPGEHEPDDLLGRARVLANAYDAKIGQRTRPWKMIEIEHWMGRAAAVLDQLAQREGM